MFNGSTCVPKHKMEDMTSTGRRNVRIMLCVTGDVLDRIRIDAQLNTQTSVPTNMITMVPSRRMVKSWLPSTHSAIGRATKNAPQCSRAMKFSGSPPMCPSISLLLMTVRRETPRFEAIAAQKPSGVKATSVLAATPTPTKTSNRLIHDFVEILVVDIISSAVRKGSADLTVCTKAMLTSLTEMLAKAIPVQCRITSGRIFRTSFCESFGGGP
mmetsp:Transcript_66169/g.170363  ORF Transcript_66169/g.170363 Transcript_66169/m.170363 type:complete len:213 (-) Transcript_66169:190-828(-)